MFTRKECSTTQSAILEHLAPDKENLNKAACISDSTFQDLLSDILCSSLQIKFLAAGAACHWPHSTTWPRLWGRCQYGDVFVRSVALKCLFNGSDSRKNSPADWSTIKGSHPFFFLFRCLQDFSLTASRVWIACTCLGVTHMGVLCDNW